MDRQPQALAGRVPLGRAVVTLGRPFAGVLTALLLVSGCTAGPGTSSTPGQAPSGAAADSSWSQGLATGPNGPIPPIVVDQFGYRPGDAKVAVLRQAVTGYDAGQAGPPGKTVRLLRSGSDEVVLEGPARPWDGGNEDPVSGDRAWWFDFSTVSEPGSYVVDDPSSGARSPEFRIDAGVYREVLRAALRTFYYQRAGQAKDGALAGDAWSDGASHLGPGQDPEATAYDHQGDPATARDLRGGWYDAGDYNKYSAWHAGYLLALLHTYAEHPDLVGDDLGIPESGNGISDLLDEIVWGLDWLARMQLDDGSVLSVEGLASASPPSAASGPSVYGSPSTNATLRSAAAFAYASTVLGGTRISALSARADDLSRRAGSAWQWASAHPRVTFYNNAEDLQPGSRGVGAGQQEVDDAGRAKSRFEAAVYLFGLTGDDSLRQEIDQSVPAELPPGAMSQWTQNEAETLLHYAGLPGATPAVAQQIQTDFVAGLTSGAQFLPAVDANADPYRAPMAEYTWGSNQSKSALGRLFALAQVHGLDRGIADRAMLAAEGYVHYLHGVNPLGIVYLTNMGAIGAEQSVSTLYHSWFADGTRWDQTTQETPGPAPGFLVGGPNPLYKVDVCCAESPACSGTSEASVCANPPTPPLGQPPMKSYAQFNTGWPANSWEVTENSNGYQVQYIRLLAAFVE